MQQLAVGREGDVLRLHRGVRHPCAWRPLLKPRLQETSSLERDSLPETHMPRLDFLHKETG
jgi:hypothetical protein